MKIMGGEIDSLRTECSILTDYFGVETIDNVLKAKLGSLYSSKMALNHSRISEENSIIEGDNKDPNSGNNSQ